MHIKLTDFGTAKILEEKNEDGKIGNNNLFLVLFMNKVSK